MILKRIENILFFILALILTLTLAARFFGVETFVVLSDSMYPSFRTNDLIFVRKIEHLSKETLEIGDIVAFNRNGKLTIHRIVELNDMNLMTKGDNNDVDDHPILYSDIYGKHLFSVYQLGLLLQPLILIVIGSLFAVYKISFKLVRELRKKE
jgi:signal peptidase